jgi:HEAT repeats/PBS lyase HEAT-like repeat
MTQVSCPGCHGEVHPLLGDAPLVLEDRVVMCCSEACRKVVLDRLTSHGSVESVVGPVTDGLGECPQRGRSAQNPGGPRGPVAAEPSGPSLVSDLAVEPPAPAESRRRRVNLSTLVGGGALVLVLVGYTIVSYAGSTRRASLSATVSSLRLSPPSSTADVASSGKTVAPASAVVDEPLPPRRRPSLMTLKKRSWTILEGFLANPTGRYWRTAARVLAGQGHAGALDVLRKALASDKWANRQRAAEALARLGHTEGNVALKKDLTSGRRPVQWASAFALARCGDSSGMRVIKQLARHRQHRMTSYEALVRLGDPRGLVYLREVLERSGAPYDRLRAAVALGMKGDRTGLTVLKARMKEPGMHMGVALALQKLGAKEARPALIRALEHTALREEAAGALRAYGDVTLVAKMVPDLNSDSENARLTAAAAIVILTAQARAEAR